MRTNEKGIVSIVIVLIIVGLIGVMGFIIYQSIQPTTISQNQPKPSHETQPKPEENQDSSTDTNWGTKEEYTSDWIDYSPDNLGISFKFLPPDPDAECGVNRVNDDEVYIMGCDSTIVQITKISYDETDLLSWWSKQTDEPDSELLRRSGGIPPTDQFDPVIVDNIQYRYAENYKDLNSEGKNFGEDILMLKIKDEYMDNAYAWDGNERYYYIPHNKGLLKVVTGYSTSTDFLIESLKLN